MLRMGEEGRGERLIRVTDKAQTPEQLIRGLQHDASLKKKKKEGKLKIRLYMNYITQTSLVK